MFCSHQTAKLNTRKKFFFSNREIKYPRNLIPLRYTENVSQLPVMINRCAQDKAITYPCRLQRKLQ